MINELLIKDYLNNIPPFELARIYNLKEWKCYDILRKAGVTRDTKFKRKYYLNENFFSEINTEEKAYWLGFLLADGCIKKRDILCLALAKKDANHLQKFLNSLNSDHKIFYSKHYSGKGWHENAIVRFRNKVIVNDLSTKGITARKSFTAKPPELETSLLKHFWRGVIDGDGCIYGGKKGKWHLEICGSYYTMESFRQWVYNIFNKKSNITHHGKIYRIRFGGNLLVPRIISTIYGDATIFLDRKMELAKQTLTLLKNHNKIDKVP